MTFCTEVVSVAARKAHRCTWCSEQIAVGEQHRTWRSVGNGQWFTNRMHPECESAMQDEYAEWREPEYMPYQNARGCTCGHHRGCPTCAARASVGRERSREDAQ